MPFCSKGISDCLHLRKYRKETSKNEMKDVVHCIVVVVCCACLACNSNSIKIRSSENSLQSLLTGTWGNPREDDPVWKIDKDSIYYLQQNKAYSYRLQDNDVLINNQEYPMELKDISFKDDTIYFHANDGGGGILMACRKK